ncbi:zinc finger BED domain-containing protein RICESLEEPER 2 [Tanacetum coccineum]
MLSVGSNTTLKNHISHPHCEAKKAQQNQNLEAGQTSIARDGSVLRYDLDYLREQFAGLVIQRALPLTTLTRTNNEVFQNTMNKNTHYAIYGIPNLNPSQTSGGATSSKVSGRNKYSRLLSGLKAHTKKKARTTDPTTSSEYERYVNLDFVTHLYPKDFASFDVLGFWKEKETMFPVLSRIAMDIISVQASSVASESAFSTSGRVLSIRRTRLTLGLLEMCMCLMDHLDAQEHKQDKCPLETPWTLYEGGL